MADHRSRPWSSVPKRKRGSPPATKRGGVKESIRKFLAGSKGSVGAIQDARTAARNSTSVTTPATTVTFESRKLASRSESFSRPTKDCGRLPSVFDSSTLTSLIARSGSVDGGPQARVDGGIKKIDHEVDHHEQEGDEQEIS